MCAAVSQDSIRPLFRTDWAKGEISKIWGSYLARNLIKKFKVRKTYIKRATQKKELLIFMISDASLLY